MNNITDLVYTLLQCALCGGTKPVKEKEESKATSKKDKSDEKDDIDGDESLCHQLVQVVCKSISRELLTKFIRCFLLESNSTSVRWQAHALVLHIYRSSNSSQQESLLELMWTLWPELPAYGRKASQFVDLLGYFALKTQQTSEKKTKMFVERAVAVLRGQNKILANHPNGSIYNSLQGLVDFDGFYLESDPCLVCNNPEVPYTNIKLSSIKVDSKFTTTTQIVKLVGSHTINKIVLRISDLKRTKMVRVMNIFYNNRTVQAVVELKNRPGLWHKAKKVVLTAGQTEVKIEFPLPIVACNLLIEYSDFYDNLQASTETLQCPRCSASVPANPGVCGNCGENVFQCHKCRAINYDEKDPFLCNACGFCKYAKFDFSLTAKPCCAVDPIENDDDRKKAVSGINTLLEKADRLYKQLQLDKPVLEALLIRISEHGHESLCESGSMASTVSSSTGGGVSSVNKAIQQLAQRYCGDCKNSFDELSKIIQKVLASRRELVDFDRQQREAAATLPSGSAPTTPVITPKHTELFKPRELPAASAKPREKLSYCFGCASATVEHCITLLRALATNTGQRNYLCSQGLVRELLEYNLRRGPPGVRGDVRQLVCLLTRDNPLATEELNLLLTHTVAAAIKGHRANTDFASSVRHEMLLLANTVQKEDSCWEQRVRCVMKLFLFAMKIKSPVVLECIALPCLRILHHLIKPDPPSTKKNKDKNSESLCTVKPGLPYLHVDVRRFLAGDPKSSFAAWRANIPQKAIDLTGPSKKKKEDKPKDRDIERRIVRVKFLMEKYGNRWRDQVALRKNRSFPVHLEDKTWVRAAVFSSSQAARHTVCSILEAMSQTHQRRKNLIDMLRGFLDDIGRSGESSNEFLGLFKRLMAAGPWKLYLAVKGVPTRLGQLINAEISNLLLLEETTLSSDLSQGFALKALTELLATFLEQDELKQHYKSRLVGTVLNGYLSLRKLVVQRTKLIDETQEKLLELLEDMTTGTESETKEFMAVCVETIEKYPLKDNLSPVFIFERLCSIIYPEENDVGEVLMSLEKDPQQEDFLQGRMLGNPYSSSEPGLGPLMRDVKNKICQDCELVALLEDDTGMELLVCNKIISLDLPVKDVYRKVWVPDHGEGEPMRVVYRMRGLLGDATEDMVNSLDSGKDPAQDEEEVYRMAAVMSECGGLAVMLKRLAAVRDLRVSSGRHLMTVLLKLMAYCTKVGVNRQQLIQLEMNTISIMLGALNLALLAEQESGAAATAAKAGTTLSEQILQTMETILQEASHQPPTQYKEFSKLCGDKDQLMVLLDRINSPFVRANASVLQALMRLIPFLAFGDHEKMLTLINHFKPYLDYNKYDVDHSQDEQLHLDCFCVIADGIERNANGDRLKDLILDADIVKDAIGYIQQHAPQIKTLLATDKDDWKDFISKPALPYVLRILAGLSQGHEKTASTIGQQLVPVLHKLEQASSDEHIGTLAENLLEAVREHPTVAAKIEDIREQTRAEKKRLAMAMRQKQLKALGMNTNEKGQVTVQSPVLKQMEELKDETGLVCCICREGNRYHPTKVLGIYTYTKRVNVDDFENKQRKTQGYTTVSHFNVVHIDCHLAAVRHARGREEWESAALQNANTRCNGLLPLWGPEVPESAFASCLARHNTYLQECTSVRDASYPYTIHDLKHILIKFAEEKSFSEDSGGGGRQSNMHLVPYLMHMALYVMNTTRSVAREEKNLTNFFKAPVEKWVENAFETEGAQYFGLLAVLILPPESFREKRLMLLKRLLVTAHARCIMPNAGSATLSDKGVKEYSVYKPYLAYLALLDGFYTTIFKKVAPAPVGELESWPARVADHLRRHDPDVLAGADRLLASFEQEILPAESFMEFCDVAELLEEVPNPGTFMEETLSTVP